MLLPDLFFSLLVVCSFGVVACYYDCSSIRSFDYSDYSASLGPNSGFDRCYPHTKPALLSSSPTDIL